jgi:hypothetical protein
VWLLPNAARWAGVVTLGLLGLFHLQFAVPNFQFAAECSGSGARGWLTCTVLYEGLLSMLAGAALIGAAYLLLSRRAVAAFAVALAGTAPLAAFFWLVAIPTDLSDEVFGVISLPVPIAAAIALVTSLLVARRRHRRDPGA